MARSAASRSAETKANQAEEARLRGVAVSNPMIGTYKTWEKLSKEADKRRTPWLSPWQDIYNYTMPVREGFFSEAPAQQRGDLIYDETAVQGIPKLASRLAAGYFPEYGEIFSLHPGPEAPAHMHSFEGQAKLNHLTEMIHDTWQNSNLGIEIGEAMVDLAVGTANICIEPGRYPGETIFTAVDPTGLAILPGPKGEIGGWFWWRKMALEDVKHCYPRATFPPEAQRDLERDSRKEVTAHFAVWRVNEPDEIERWKFVVVLKDYGEKGVIYERVDEGEGSCAWAGVRWSKAGRDVWGRGPIQLIMPAIKTCNLTVQMILENAELALGGMWVYDNDGVFDPESVEFVPGTFIPKSPEGKIEPLQSGTRFDVSQLILAEQRMNIKRGLYVDEMDKEGSTPYSAQEIAARRADISRDLTAPGSRITKELIVPMVNRQIWIYEKQGLLDAAGLRVDGKRIRMKVKSPFLRGQDAIIMQEMLTAAGHLNAIFGAGTAGMAFKMEETAKEIFRRNGVDPRFANSRADIERMGQQGGQAMGQVADATGGQAGDPMAVLGPLMKAGQSG